MTREAFIRKWLANPQKQYNEQCRDEMRDDLDLVIEAAFRQPLVGGSLSKSYYAVEAMKSLIRNGNLSIDKDKRAEKLAELSWQIADEMLKRQ